MSRPGSRASELFLALADVPPADREAWLDAHCGADAALRAEVESLLAALDAPDDFLDPDALHPHVLDADTPLAAGTRVGEFTIQGVIGTGAAGIVYIAQQRHPSRTVALKILRRDLAASSARRRFEVEAELLGQLHHPGIAQIFAAHPGDETIPPFIAMEFVDGPPISEYVVEHRLDLRAKVELMARVSDAVQHAHQRGVIHRDLKPANVLVTRDGSPKILDFGVARRSGAAVAISTVTTEIGQLVGTVAFMSPEQVAAVPSEVDTRSDVYALGVILFRLITGHLPFAHDNPPLPELARRIAIEDAPRLSAVDRSFAGDLDTILATALAKEKERRYQAAADFGADLRRWLAGQPIAASADSSWYVVRQRLIRYRRALTAAVVAFVALGTLAAFAIVQRSRAVSTNVRLGDELATSNIERARLLGMTGNLRAAEAALWHELFARPDSNHALWALWELYAQQPTLWTRILHPNGTTTVFFDPYRNVLITAGQDRRVRIVDPATGHERQVLEGEAPDTASIAVMPQTHRVVVASSDGTLRLWDQDGSQPRTIKPEGSRLLGMAALSSDELAISIDGHVQIVSIPSGGSTTRVDLGDVSTTLIDATPDGRLLAVGTETGDVLVWDVRQRQTLWKTTGHQGRVSAVKWTPDGSLVASGGADQRIALHDGTTGKTLQSIQPANGTVRALAFDGSGRTLAAAGWWRTLLLDASGDGLRERASFAEPTWRLDLSADGAMLFTCTEGRAGEVRAWQLRADPRIARWTPDTSRIVALATTGNVPTVATGGANGAIRVGVPGSGAPAFSAAEPGGLLGLEFESSGQRLLTASRDGELSAWNLGTGQKEATTYGGLVGQNGSTVSGASSFGASDDGRYVAIGQRDGIAVWQWNGSKFERAFDAPSADGEVLGIAIHGKRIAVAHRGDVAVVRELSSGRELHRFPTETAPFSVAWSPDERSLAVGTWSGLIEVFDLDAGKRSQALRAHTRVVSGVAWSPENGLLASASRDGSVRLWDVEHGQALATLAQRDTGASRVRLLSRQRLLVGYDDGGVELRDLNYFFRHVAGQVEYQREILERAHSSRYSRAGDVLAWSRKILEVPVR